VPPSLSLFRNLPHRLFGVVSVGAILFGASCSSLKPVADFGKNASSVAGFPGVAEDYPQSLERQRLYGQVGSSVSDENIAKRKRDAQRLLAAQKVLEAYARALGTLASDDLISYDKELDALNKSLVDGKFATSAQTEGYAKVAKFGFRFVTDFYRRAKIKRIIVTYNPSVQSAAEQLAKIVEDGYLTALAGEQTMFTQLVVGRAKKSTTDLEGVPQLVVVVANEHEQALKKKEANAKLLVKGIREFGKGHQELAENIDKIDFKQSLEIARKYAEELRGVIKAFKS
jgi:hypothetical protein